jgi:hypothetical protein
MSVPTLEEFLSTEEHWRVRQDRDTFTNNPNKEEIIKKYFGRKHTEETKNKISINNANKKGFESHNFGRIQSDEEKNKRKISFLKNGFPMKGKNHTEETKKRISENKKGIKLTKEHKEKISKIKKARKIRNFQKN